MTTMASSVTDAEYVFRRDPGPVPGTWAISLTCPHGVTTAYLAARRSPLPDEGVAILELLAERHRRERQVARVVAKQRPKGWAIESGTGEPIVAAQAAMLAIHWAMTSEAPVSRRVRGL